MDNLLNIVERNNSLPNNATLDFNALREEGTAYIAQLGHELWTDFNTHDPGITMLEVLCYAINDLAYRTDLPIEDLLSYPTGIQKTKQFYTAAEILTCHPVTALDYRKLLIDCDGVKNAWLFKAGASEQEYYKTEETDGIIIKYYPSREVPEGAKQYPLNGLYTICLDLDDRIDPTDTLTVNAIKKEVSDKLSQYRNLAEDFHSIEVVGVKKVCLNVSVVAADSADVNEIEARVYYQIEQFLSTAPQFYGLQELLEMGKTCDEVYQGIILDNGFLLDEEVTASKLRRTIYTSDLYREIKKIEGVEAIKCLSISLCKEKNGETETDTTTDNEKTWCLDIYQDNGQVADTTSEYKPLLNTDASSVCIQKGRVVLPTNAQEVQEKLVLLRHINRRPAVNAKRDVAIPSGKYRSLDQYFSIQEDFPQVYRVGKDQLSSRLKPKHKGQIKQLKAFLTFFDQLLANYLAQLDQVKETLAVHSTPKDSVLVFKSLLGLDPCIDALIQPFYQWNDKLKEALSEEVAGQLECLRNKPPMEQDAFLSHIRHLKQTDQISEEEMTNIEQYGRVENYYENQLGNIIENELERFNRRNKVLDHLIARFGEKFTDYALSLFPISTDDSCKTSTIKLKDNLLHCKTDFLKSIPELGRDRSKGMNYKGDDCLKKEAFWQSSNVTGMQKRVNKLLCLGHSKRVQLSCEPKFVVAKKRDDANRSFHWVVIEKGKQPNSPDAPIFLKGLKDYTLRAKGTKEQKLIQDTLFEANKSLTTDEDLKQLRVEQVTEKSQFQIILTNEAGKKIAESEPFKDEKDAQSLRDELATLIFPEDCEAGGFHVLEHILLRADSKSDTELDPIPLDGSNKICDPYSFWITVLALKSWKQFSDDNGGRIFFEQLVRRETPAHVGINFLWLEADEMYRFEHAYKNWLYDLARKEADDCQLDESRDRLIKQMNTLLSPERQNSSKSNENKGCLCD